MRFLVVGAGRMGHAVVYDLLHHSPEAKVIVADSDSAKLDAIVRNFNSRNVSTIKANASDSDELSYLMSGVDVAISCVTYMYNYELAKAAIEAGASFIDLGGNEDVVRREFLLDEMARERGVAIIPDCGLAPGMVSILAAAAYDSLDEIHDVHLRVGGLPIEPRPPLNYALIFSVEGLINEYVEDATVIRDGKLMRVSSLDDLEELDFPAPFGKMEAFNTSGGISTLPNTLGNRVKNLDYKTIRYPGHCEKIRLLKDIGMMDSTPMKVGALSLSPRAMLAHMLESRLPKEEPDVVLIRVDCSGMRDGHKTTISWELIDYMDEETGLTAMMRATAFPAAIIAQMIAKNEITGRGALTQEENVPQDLFLTELKKRGLNLTRSERQAVTKKR